MYLKEENKHHGQLAFFNVLFNVLFKKQEKRKEKKENQNKSEKKKGNIISTKKRKEYMRIKCYSEMTS